MSVAKVKRVCYPICSNSSDGCPLGSRRSGAGGSEVLANFQVTESILLKLLHSRCAFACYPWPPPQFPHPSSCLAESSFPDDDGLGNA